MRIKKVFFSLFFSLTIFSLKADIVSDLQKDLWGPYFSYMEKHFSPCDGDKKSCLTPKEDYMFLSLPKKDLCYPYTVCGYYNCMEQKYHCMDVGVNYFKELAFPTCSQYVKNIDAHKFSEEGKKWIYSVMVCLQKGLTEECEIKGNCEKNSQKETCNYIVDFTLKFHPGCYINSGPGVCKLPLKDKLQIWKTVAPYLTKREREEAYKVVFYCLKPIK